MSVWSIAESVRYRATVLTLRTPRIFDDHEESEAIERLGNDSTSVGGGMGSSEVGGPTC